MNKRNCCYIVVVCFFLNIMNGISAQINFSGTIENDATLNVPDDFGTIQDALAYLSGKSIPREFYVTIQVADGTYNNYNTIVIDHPQSRQIRIIGNQTNSSLCTLNFAQDKSGFLITADKVDLISGFKLNGQHTTGSSIGISANDHATIQCGTNMQIYGFSCGVSANHLSYIVANYMVICNCVNGFLATSLSCIDANFASVSGATSKGYHASRNSTIIAHNSTASNNNIGYLAGYNSHISGGGATAQNNSNAGFYCYFNSVIDLTTNSSSINNSYGMYIGRASYASAPTGCNISGNTYNYSPSIRTVGNDNSYISSY